MSLNFREKRQLQKTVAEQQAALRGGDLGFREKRQAQKAMREALEKLGAGNQTPAAQESAQYRNYLEWIQDAERTRSELEAGGFSEQIKMDDRLENGEAERLLAEIQQRIEGLSDATPSPIDPANTSPGDTVEWRNEMGTIRGNYRGATDDGRHAVIVYDGGKQASAPVGEVFPAEPSGDEPQGDLPSLPATGEEEAESSEHDELNAHFDRFTPGVRVVEKAPPASSVIMRVRDFRGRHLGTLGIRHDGSKEGKLAVLPLLNRAYQSAFGKEASFTQSQRGITDENGDMTEVLSPTGEILAAGTDEAAYMLGNLSARPKESATLTAQAARGDFNGLGLPEFIEKLKEAYGADEDLEGAKKAAIGYLGANRTELEEAA